MGTKKKIGRVVSHLRQDIRGYTKEIKEDKELIKALKRGKKDGSRKEKGNRRKRG